MSAAAANISTELFCAIPESILRHDSITDKAVRLYGILYMLIFREPSRVIQVTHKSLSKEMKCSPSTIRDAVASLKEAGALETWSPQTGYDGNFYRLKGADRISATPPTDFRLPPPQKSVDNSSLKELIKKGSDITISQAGFPDTWITEEEAKIIWDDYEDHQWFYSPWDRSSIRRKDPSLFGIPDLREKEAASDNGVPSGTD